MKKILDFVNKLPSVIIYILFIALLTLFVYAFPRLFSILGFIWKNGLYIFFGGLFVFLLIYNIVDRKKL